MLASLFAGIFYIAALIFVIGVGRKIIQYARTPAPLKIPTTPAPVTQTGVVLRMIREIVLFSSLFKANKWTWIFGWLFHFGLLLAFFRHLRYTMTPDALLWPLVSFDLVQSFGRYASFIMFIGLVGLLGRRFFVDRVRYISAPSDYLMLLLLLTIAGTGMLMSFVAHPDIIMLKEFVLGLLRFEVKPLPTDGLLLVHLSLVALLMVIFPISKLLHAPGLFFSPSRNQVDNPREKRHLASWAAKFDADQS